MTYSRRDFFKACTAVGLTASGIGSASAQSVPYADPLAADEWVQKAITGALGSATGPLHVGRFADRVYFLLNEIDWTPEPGQKVGGVKVPTGFVTDFASIPRIFWTVLPPDAEYTYAAVIHDYLYWEQRVSRADADLTFRYVMEEFKVAPLAIQAVYTGVRAGGESAWRENAALKKAGERRVIKQFPKDPKVRWDDWKKGTVY